MMDWLADELLGTTESTAELRALVARVAPTTASVVVSGEVGTGAPELARAIHASSPEPARPFVAISCRDVPAPEARAAGDPSMAFRALGVPPDMEGGTVFLEEVSDLPLPVQWLVAGALQRRRGRGPDRGAADRGPRIIASTTRELELEVEARRFRSDLLYCLRIVEVDLLPLRQRRADIAALARRVLRFVGTRDARRALAFSNAAMQQLEQYDWPGNVAELCSCVERAALTAASSMIGREDLPRHICADQLQRAIDEGKILPLAELERRWVLDLLRMTRGNRTRAAELLGIDRRTLTRKLARFRADAERSSDLGGDGRHRRHVGPGRDRT